MGTCPNCQHEIADDFGLTVCANCGSQVLVGESLQVTASAASEAGPQPNTPPPFPAEVFELHEGETAGPQGPSMPVEVPEFKESNSPLAEPLTEPLKETVPAEDLSDVQAFANSEMSLGTEGPLLYRIVFSDIDTAEVRQELHETLADDRFFWDADRLVRSIKSGQLILEDVSAAKAFLLIDRVKNLPITIRWEQYAIHQS